MLNSSMRNNWGGKCTREWPCKKMSCKHCVFKRREYFLRNGGAFVRKHSLNVHFTISWPLTAGEDYWSKILTIYPALRKKLSPRIGKHIWVLGIGEIKRTPHVHYLITEESVNLVYTYAKKIRKVNVITHVKKANDPETLLGYLYDKNFVPATSDPERPPRTRVMSGSRGMRYGFPPTKKKK